MDIIIKRVNILAKDFEQFCSVLTTQPCFRGLVDDMTVFYIVAKNKTEIQSFIQVDKILLYLEDQLTTNQKLTLSNREECFVKILLDRPKFTRKFMECLALQDCPSHTELYHWLQSLINSFKEFLPSILNIHVSNTSIPIQKYQDHLKEVYTTHFQLVEQSNLNAPKIHQYVNLSLITPDETETMGDYFKAVVDPYNVLFKHKEQNSNIKLKSILEIFDGSKVGRQVILVQGSPGTGKTTLANKLCQEWAAGNLLQNYKLVILLKLRDFRISYMENINELIHCSTGDKDFAYEASCEITSIDGEGVLILLEGWDELPEERQSQSFFVKIISGRILTKVSVLITSRPSSIGSIQKGFVTRNIAILGFSKDQIEQYLDCCFPQPSNKRVNKLKQQFLDQLTSHLALETLACIPVNLSILVSVFQQCGGRLPNSLTELYEQYLLLKLSRHYQRMDASHASTRFMKLDKGLPKFITENLYKLGKLAFHKLKGEILTFGEDEIKKYCFLHEAIPSSFDGMGLLQIENDILNKSTYKTYHFLHRTVQEFLAAWYLSQKQQQKQEQHLIKIFDNRTFEVVWIFYAGITGFKGIEIKSILSNTVLMEKVFQGLVAKFNETITITGKILVKNRNAQHIKLMSSEARDYYSAAVSKFVSNEFLLVLISCCAEAQNPAACQALSNSRLFYTKACYIKIPDSAVTPQVLSSLSYCIAYSSKQWIVEFPCYLQDQDILNLHKCLDSQRNSGELTTLFTYTSKYQIEFFMILIQSCRGLSYLDISFSESFNDYCTDLLAETLKHNTHLIILELRGCNISSKGILAIAEMLLINNTLEWLDLEKNSFTTSDLMQVLEMIKTNTTLSLMEVDKSLVEENVKLLLAEFNKERKVLLRLNRWDAIFKGHLPGVMLKLGATLCGKAKEKLKDVLQ